MAMASPQQGVSSTMRFLVLDNVLLQPHHASGTMETRKVMGDLVFENLSTPVL